MMQAAGRETIQKLARTLLEAETGRRPIAPLTETCPWLGLEDAYAVQREVIAARTAAGARIIGRKVGLTSLAMQRMFNVSEPDYGYLLDTMMVDDGGAIEMNAMLQPKAEAEIAFLLEKDLAGPDAGIEEAMAATRFVAPALEIIDSRIAGWRIKLADTIADNASCGRIVIGRGRARPGDIDLRLVGMVLEKNGEVAATGAGAAVLGNSANAVAWLANKLAETGERLRAGDVVLPGSLAAAVSLARGDRLCASFDRMGEVRVTFV